MWESVGGAGDAWHYPLAPVVGVLSDDALMVGVVSRGWGVQLGRHPVKGVGGMCGEIWNLQICALMPPPLSALQFDRSGSVSALQRPMSVSMQQRSGVPPLLTSSPASSRPSSGR